MKPKVYNYGNPKERTILRPGMVFAIEPVVVEGDNEHYMENAQKECYVEPGRLSAQFEHTVLVTPLGCKILTESPKGIYLPASIRDKVLPMPGGRGY